MVKWMVTVLPLRGKVLLNPNLSGDQVRSGPAAALTGSLLQKAMELHFQLFSEFFLDHIFQTPYLTLFKVLS